MLIQPHFDYGCSSWFPLLKKKFKTQTSKSSKQMYLLLPKLSPRSALRIPFLSTGMEMYQNIVMKCLSRHSADIARDHWHWTYLCGKQIQGKKAYPS